MAAVLAVVALSACDNKGPGPVSQPAAAIVGDDQTQAVDARDKIAKLDDRVSALEQQVSTDQSDIAMLKHQVADQEVRIAYLKNGQP